MHTSCTVHALQTHTAHKNVTNEYSLINEADGKKKKKKINCGYSDIVCMCKLTKPTCH